MIDKKIASTLLVASTLAIGLSFTTSVAAEACSFTRSLEMEMTGEDVKCLQKYLNGSGFTIATNGVGSAGRETDQFKTLTKEALIKWQRSNNVTPASGFFGPLSQQKYKELTTTRTNPPKSDTVTTPKPTAPATPSIPNTTDAPTINLLLAEIQKLKSDLKKAQDTSSNNNDSGRETSEQREFKKDFREAVNMIEDAEDQLKDGNFDVAEAKSIQDDINDAREDLFEGVVDYFKENYDEALRALIKSIDNASNAYEDAGGVTQEDEIDDFIEELEDAIKEAEDQIDKADDDGEDVDEAEDLLEEAEERLDEAKDKLDDGDIDKAEKLAKEAEDLIEESIDAIGESDNEEDEARDEIRDAKDVIKEAEDQIDEADDDGEDVDEAEELLEEAEDALKDAEDEYDDEDYDRAISRAKKAQDLARDARRAL